MQVSKDKSKRVLKNVLKEGVFRLFQGAPTKTLNYKQVSSILDAKDDYARKIISLVLSELVDEGSLLEAGRGKYRFNKNSSSIIGRLDGTQQGDAYLVS